MNKIIFIICFITFCVLTNQINSANSFNSMEIRINKIKFVNNFKDRNNLNQIYKFGKGIKSTSVNNFEISERLIDYFGKEIKIISVNYYSNYFDSFDEVEKVINEILITKPKALYTYLSWAEEVSLNIKCVIEFDDGNKSLLEVGSIGRLGIDKKISNREKMFNYVVFQKENNSYWFRL